VELGKLLNLIMSDTNFQNSGLWSLINEFKIFRNDTLHNLLFGFYNEIEIKNKVMCFKNLGNEVFEFVIKSVGEPYDKNKIQGI
jgi:hypothetical protein